VGSASVSELPEFPPPIGENGGAENSGQLPDGDGETVQHRIELVQKGSV